MLRALGQIGEAVLVRELGRGAHCSVWLGRRGSEPVAIKVPDDDAPERVLAGLRREAVLLARLGGRGFPALDAYGVLDGKPWIAQRYVRGATLAGNGQPWPVERVIAVGQRIALALRELHALDMVHRDLKPANVLVGEHADELVIIDLDLAAPLGQSGRDAVIGTPLYSAPEQSGLVDLGVDARTDLYSLGAVLFELLTGKPPFQGATTAEILHAHVHRPVPALPARVPARLASLVTSLLAKDPRDRPASAERTLDALSVMGTPLVAPAPAPRPRVRGELIEQVVDELWTRARPGLLITGPPGSGRAQLVGQVARALEDRGALVLTVRPAGEAPFTALAQAVRRLQGVEGRKDALAAIEAAQAGQTARGLVDANLEGGRAVQAEVAKALVELAGDRHLALAVKELDRLDASSQAALRAMWPSAHDGPLLIASGTHAGGVAEPAVVSLRPLSPGDQAVLVEELLGAPPDGRLLEVLVTRAGGSPAGLTTFVRALIAADALVFTAGTWQLADADAAQLPLPADLARLLLDAAAQLSPATAAVLRHVALLPRELEPELLARAAGVSLTEAEDALVEGAQLLDSDESGRLRVVHEIVLSWAADRLSDEDRQAALARLVALADEPDVADRDLLFHVVRWGMQGAGQRDRLYELAVLAAERSARAFADELAHEMYAAAEVFAPERLARDAAVGVHRGELAFRLGDYPGALGLLAAARAQLDDPVERARVLAVEAFTHVQRSAWAEANASLALAFAELGHPAPTGSTGRVLRAIGTYALFRKRRIRDLGDQGKQRWYQTVLQLLSMAGYISYWNLERGKVAEILFRAQTLVEGCQPGVETVTFLQRAAVGYAVRGQKARALERLARARQQALELGDRRVLTMQMHMEAIGAEVLDRVDEVAPIWREVLRHADTDLVFSDYRNACHLWAWGQTLRGNLDEAERWLDQIVRLNQERGRVDVENLAHGALVCALRGQWSRVDELLAAADGEASPNIHAAVHVLETRLFADALRGRWDDAMLQRTRELVGSRFVSIMARRAFVSIARAELERLRARPDDPDARTRFLRAVKDAGAKASAGHLAALVALLDAYAGLYTGDQDRFARASALVLTFAERWQAPLLHAEHLLLRFTWQQRHGADETALAALAAQAVAHAEGAGLMAFVPRYAGYAQAGTQPSADPTAGRGARADLASLRVSRYLDAVERLNLAASGSFDAPTLVRRALDEILRIIGGERALFLSTSAEQPGLELLAGRTSAGADCVLGDDISRSAVDKARVRRDAVIVSASEGHEIDMSSSLVAHDLRSVIVAPVLVRERLLGFLYVDSRVSAGIFDGEAAGVLRALATHVGIAMETARVATLERERGELERNLTVAATVQQLLMPEHQVVTLGETTIAAYHSAASQSGGDWWWTERLPDGTALALIVDVTGHGVGAAMVASVLAGAYHAYRHRGEAFDARALFRTLNQALIEVCHGRYLATASLVLVRDDQLTLLSAAAPPVLVASPAGVQAIGRRSPPLGTQAVWDSEPRTVTLPRGSRVLLFSDGLSDLPTRTGRMIGLRAISDELSRSLGTRAELLTGAIKGLVEAAPAEVERDDVTAVVVDAGGLPAASQN
jgi:serine phosphatase RsbU (regulator of sigma subunit)/predicted Ser/Thr protein kinase